MFDQTLQEEKRKYMREYARQRRANDPVFLEKCRENGRKSRLKRLDKAKQEVLTWKNQNKEKIAEYNKQYATQHKTKIAVQQSKRNKKRLKTDPIYVLVRRERNRIWNALKGKTKSEPTINLLGCPYEYFKNYIENLFLDGMNWQNTLEWHIDHIKPLSSFNLHDLEQQKIAFHYTNQRPLWAADNLKKGAKIE